MPIMVTQHDGTVIRGRLAASDGATVELAVPGTAYRLVLACSSPLEDLPGSVVRGCIEASAMKVHHASAGGRFIEPTTGSPRIIAGRVQSVSEDQGTAVVQSVVPITIHPERSEDFASLQPGAMVNFHVRSGAEWSPCG